MIAASERSQSQKRRPSPKRSARALTSASKRKQKSLREEWSRFKLTEASLGLPFSPSAPYPFSQQLKLTTGYKKGNQSEPWKPFTTWVTKSSPLKRKTVRRWRRLDRQNNRENNQTLPVLCTFAGLRRHGWGCAYIIPSSTSTPFNGSKPPIQTDKTRVQCPDAKSKDTSHAPAACTQ